MKRWLVTIILCVALFNLLGITFAGHIDDVRATIYSWANAWQRQDIIQYMAFYSPTFQWKESDYQSWLNDRAKLFQTPGKIRVEISDLWVFIEGKHATAQFVQRYQDRNRADIVEKTLILTNANDRWMIMSEEWRPLKPSVQTRKERSAITNHNVLDTKIETTDDATRNHKKNTVHPDEIIVKNIEFNVDKDHEKICLGFNKFYIPAILTLEEKKPRIVIDIKNVFFWKGRYKTPVNGRLVKQLRTYWHRDINKLRIVLDLNFAEDYIIDQAYNETENVYCIEVK